MQEIISADKQAMQYNIPFMMYPILQLIDIFCRKLEEVTKLNTSLEQAKVEMATRTNTLM